MHCTELIHCTVLLWLGFTVELYRSVALSDIAVQPKSCAAFPPHSIIQTMNVFPTQNRNNVAFLVVVVVVVVADRSRDVSAFGASCNMVPQPEAEQVVELGKIFDVIFTEQVREQVKRNECNAPVGNNDGAPNVLPRRVGCEPNYKIRIRVLDSLFAYYYFDKFSRLLSEGFKQTDTMVCTMGKNDEEAHHAWLGRAWFSIPALPDCKCGNRRVNSATIGKLSAQLQQLDLI